MRPFTRHRRSVTRLCLVTLLLGFTAQQHALSHALKYLRAQLRHDALAGHAQACEQSLQFARVDSSLPVAAAAWLPPAAQAFVGSAPVLPWRCASFTAYDSRAPPPRG